MMTETAKTTFKVLKSVIIVCEADLEVLMLFVS